MSRKYVLAITKDGRMSKCFSPPDRRGMYRCDHEAHQDYDESEEEFQIRVNELIAKYRDEDESIQGRDIEITAYRMSEEEKQSLTEIKGRKQLADETIEGGYIPLNEPLWNDVDKKEFSKISNISVASINNIIKGDNHIIEHSDDNKYPKGRILSKTAAGRLSENEDVTLGTGVIALNKYARNLGFKATEDVYVLPYYMRQDPPEGDSKHPLNSLYNNLIISRKDPQRQQAAYDKLLDNKAAEKPMLGRSGYAMPSLSSEFKGKSGIMRADMSGRRIVHSGRAVASACIDLEYGEAAIPASMAANIFKPTLEDRLKQEGYTEEQADDWFEKFNKSTPNIKREDMQELSLYVRESGMKCILNRAPSLHESSLLAFRPRISSDNTIKMNPMNCSGYNLDFDGDEMTCYGINDLRISKITEEISAESDSGTKLPRHKETNIIMPTKESLFGLLNILNNRSE